MKSMLLLVLGFSLLLPMAAQADGFSWHINCGETNPDSNQHHVWVGYSADQDYPDSFSYVGNGPGIYFDRFLTGQHDKVLDVLTDYGDVVLYGPGGASLTITSETSAPDCNAPTGLQSGHLDLTDSGAINDPRLSDDANTCYSSGQSCSTPEQWTAGWYAIRKAYGLL